MLVVTVVVDADVVDVVVAVVAVVAFVAVVLVFAVVDVGSGVVFDAVVAVGGVLLLILLPSLC